MAKTTKSGKPAARRKVARKAKRTKTAGSPKAAAKRKTAAKRKVATKRKAAPKRKAAAKRATAKKATAKRRPTVKKRVASKKKRTTRKSTTRKAAPKRKVTAKRKATKAKPKKTVTKRRPTSKAKARKPANKRVAPKKRAAQRTRTVSPKKAAAKKPVARKAAPKPKATPKPAVKRVQPQVERDWSETLFLPKTDFPMKAGLPRREPELLERWAKMGLYDRLRKEAMSRPKFVLHDGPPYANGRIHIGTALNKILKDAVTRSHAMMGKDANYVPGWDCHGLPIEWKVEEENYRAKGRAKPDLSDTDALIAFRRECRDEAAKWLDVQREEFKRLGVEGDWDHPYTTMSYEAEATIARELTKFAMNGLLYRGSKPVMWSVVERTALAEAEVEYQEIESPTIYVKFPVMFASEDSQDPQALQHASVVIWTTTPWTIPGNRAISYSPSISYGLYEVTQAPADNWANVGERLILADALAETVKEAARIDGWSRQGDVTAEMLRQSMCAHPLRGQSDYRFMVPLLSGEHVTEETGTGFVHTAPGHGVDDFEVWSANERLLRQRDIDSTIPFTVDEAGFFTSEAPRFEGSRVVNDKGKFGDANEAVIKALAEANALIARARYKHDYPHSWRSKKPVIFRATPQWFIAMDRGFEGGEALRARALDAIDGTQFVPPQGEKRIKGMVETRPDWVVSRQRAWGVPITVFVHQETGDVIPRRDFDGSGQLIDRIVSAFEAEGADAWFVDGAKERFLDGLVDSPGDWEKAGDILDVWFDSGCTHAFVLEARPDLKWPADLYLEGSDQHRGWFQSSLLEGCGTRGRAPFGAVATHGFVNEERGRKMSKSLGNVVAPQDVIKQSGAEILRLWAMSSDYTEDLRFGPDIVKANVDSYRRLRNTLRFLLGNLAHYRDDLVVPHDEMPELERYMLARVSELDGLVREGYRSYEFKRIFHALFNFCVNDMSAFYLDIRKDALYCDASDSVVRRAALTVMDRLFAALTAWLAPMLCFTMEEAWMTRFPEDKGSVHLRQFPDVAPEWCDDALTEKWRKVRNVRRVVTGALEIERKEGRIGSSLEAAPKVYVADKELRDALSGIDLAEIAITSGATLIPEEGPRDAFRLDDVPGVAVVFAPAKGNKCARSWKISPDVGADLEFPTLSPRDADAVRQFDARGRKGR
jgi:isoleucyl-tRNA synthetase